MVKELLKKLSNAHGVSGSESSVFAVIKKELKGHVDEIREDSLGNLIAIKRGNKFKVMLAAHMDEIGLMVKYVDEKGLSGLSPWGVGTVRRSITSALSCMGQKDSTLGSSEANPHI